MLRLTVLALTMLAAASPQDMLTLEIRVFDRDKDVTGQTRVTVHVAGDRGAPVGQIAGKDPRAPMRVPPGFYDAQAVHLRDGKVVNIRWAERLVVMPYPDEGGHHLQVINLATGFGALQIRPESPLETGDTIALVGAGGQEHAAAAHGQHGYVLFVVPAGMYDLQVVRGGRTVWHRDMEIPLDRTRFLVVP